MPIIETDYTPPFLSKNRHFNTIYSSLFRRIKRIPFKRKRIETSDNDFLDVDLIDNGSKKIVILCHGLEGSSNSKYILATAKLLSKNGYSIAAMNYRFCSGEINRQLITYHSGKTDDLHTVINYVLPNYDAIYLVGFSLGGNLILKYNGDGLFPLSSKIKASVAISVPIDLKGSSISLQKRENKLYNWRFLRTLSKKMFLKHNQFPKELDIKPLKTIKNLTDFDEYFTSKINGFKNAQDYYFKASSKQFICNISRPTLLINAKDDPFLSQSCFPINEAKNSLNFYLMIPKYGGHVGFISKGDFYWSENQILKFIDRY
ncbi:alpha/beta fold hydrolase [Flavobacteriaceae bacterium]|nr:alpha/beta fold hydrolase [Flavobacteriaceae bacterium]